MRTVIFFFSLWRSIQNEPKLKLLNKLTSKRLKRKIKRNHQNKKNIAVNIKNNKYIKIDSIKLEKNKSKNKMNIKRKDIYKKREVL